MDTIIVEKKINIDQLKDMAAAQFGDMVKAVVDIDKEIMAIGGELHADQEAILLELDSKQENLWGINLWVNKDESDWIEFDSMINIRPSQNNRSRIVEDAATRDVIVKLVNKLVKR